MISDALRTDIEGWAGKWRQGPMFALAMEGRMTPAIITRYVANVTHMIRLTIGHLRSARDAARGRSDEDLAHHYEHKIDEEIGHDKWGDADLEKLTQIAPAHVADAIADSIKELAKYLDKTTAEEPAEYLCYLALTEYITVLLGPELLALIEERNGVPRSSITVIDKHIELDINHSEEAWGVIDDLVGDPKKIVSMRAALATMCGYFDRLWVDLATNTVMESGEVSIVEMPNANVSAA